MAELAAINAVDGLDLDTIIADGAAVYVIGSTRNSAVIAAQRMLLVKLIQIAERRENRRRKAPANHGSGGRAELTKSAALC